ncbi:MAG TPA: peptidoglycan-binding protein, partial [Acidimicrobiia bacterium]
PLAAQEQFCSDVETHVEAIGRYGGLFEDVELTVGEVKTAQQELEPSLEAVEESAEEFRTAVETDPTSGLSIDLVEPETLEAVQAAEEAFAQASDIDDRTPVVDAGIEFNSAAYQLEVAWVRLFVDAGCLEGDARAEAEAQQWVSDYVAAIQTDLRTIGYYQGEVDGIYGPMTIEAVERFQEDSGLPITGLFDPPTQAAMQLALDDRESAQVGALQAIMIATGHYSGPVDGVWSPAVEAALFDLQEDLGVPASGVIDAATLRALEDALAASDEDPVMPTSTPETTPPPADTTTTLAEATTTTVDAATTTTVPAEGGILDVLAEAGQFEQFLAAVETAGLTDMLSGPGPLTVFAPTDDAFEAAGGLPEDPEALAEVIMYHVVDGALSGFDVQDSETLLSLQGPEITVGVEQGIITLNGTTAVTIANIAAGNGVVHAVNAVLAPPS